MLIRTGIAVANPAYNDEEPEKGVVRLFINKPGRLFSMDESRLTNDTTEKNKSKGNRSIVGSAGDSGEVLANKGGGDGTGIGGSSADGLEKGGPQRPRAGFMYILKTRPK